MSTKNTRRFKSFYQHISNKYDASRYKTKYGMLFSRLHHTTIKKFLSKQPRHSRLLEVACGTGHTSYLLNDLHIDFIACDLTLEMMRQAQNNKLKYGTFLLANAFRLPFSDCSFDIVVSTRFLHLFQPDEQTILLKEMRRVLSPGGKLIVDFDNAFSRNIYALPSLIYNILRYRRFVPDNNYNYMSKTTKILRELGQSQVKTFGVGGYHLLLAAIFSKKLAYSFGLLHEKFPLKLLAEQFIVTSIKENENTYSRS